MTDHRLKPEQKMEQKSDAYPTQIPLPNQIPQSPSVDHLPQAILYSQTVQSLLNQNEDLTTRLTITLKRHAEIEKKLLQLQESQKLLVQQNDSMMDEIAILRDKNRVAEQSMLEAISLKEDLRKNSEALQFELQEQVRKLENELREFRVAYKGEVEDLTRKALDRQSQLLDGRDKFESDLIKLTSHHEEERQTWNEKVTQLESELNSLKRRNENLAKNLLQEQENKVHLEHRTLYAEKKATEIETHFENLMERLNEENVALKNELQGIGTTLRKAQTTCAVYEAELKDNSNSLSSAKDELSKSLQAQGQAETEKAQLQKKLAEAQSLVGELTNIVRDQRIEIEKSRLDVAEAWTTNTHKVRRLQRRLDNQVFGQKIPASFEESETPKNSETSKNSDNDALILIAKIDAALNKEPSV